MEPMRNLREAVVILAAVALAAFAAYGLALTAAGLRGGLEGWGALAAVVLGGVATFVALVSSILAALVVRHRGWRIAYVLLTLAGVVYVGLGAFWADSADERLSVLAMLVAFALAAWLPVGARWWLDRVAIEPDPAAPTVSRRAAATAGVLCGAVVVVVSLITLALAGSSIPTALLGLAIVLLVVAAATSGRVPDTMALALLAGVGLCAVLSGLPSLPDGGLVTGALALVVLVAFSWRSFAVRITAARRATVPPPTPSG